MRRILPAFRLLCVACLCCFAVSGIARTPETTTTSATITLRDLPREARETLHRIDKGGPFPYARDDTVFGNYEQRLPPRPRGYYREYTVPTPGSRNRGARRIVAGASDEDHERYYSADHYRHFRRIVE